MSLAFAISNYEIGDLGIKESAEDHLFHGMKTLTSPDTKMPSLMMPELRVRSGASQGLEAICAAEIGFCAARELSFFD